MAIANPNVMLYGGGGGLPVTLPAGSTPTVMSDPAQQASSDGSDNSNLIGQILGAIFPTLIGGLQGNVAGSVQAIFDNRTVQEIVKKVGDGAMSPLDAQEKIASDPNLENKLTPEQKDFLINMLEQFTSQQSYDRSIQSIIDSVKAQQEAAQLTGMNASSYIQGQSSGINVDKAGVSHTNTAEARTNRNMNMAQRLLTLIGGMASAGIYGGSIAAAKTAVAKLTTDASLTATKANNYTKLLMRRRGQSTFDRNGNFISHTDYDY